jgi:hypothetical protein
MILVGVKRNDDAHPDRIYNNKTHTMHAKERAKDSWKKPRYIFFQFKEISFISQNSLNAL